MISCCSLQPVWPEHPWRTEQQLWQEIGNLVSTINSIASHPPLHLSTPLSESPTGSGRAFTPATGIELCECGINVNSCSNNRHWTNGKTSTASNPMFESFTGEPAAKEKGDSFFNSMFWSLLVKLNVSIDSQMGGALIFYAHAFSIAGAIQLKTKSCKGFYKTFIHHDIFIIYAKLIVILGCVAWIHNL